MKIFKFCRKREGHIYTSICFLSKHIRSLFRPSGLSHLLLPKKSPPLDPLLLVLIYTLFSLSFSLKKTFPLFLLVIANITTSFQIPLHYTIFKLQFLLLNHHPWLLFNPLRIRWVRTRCYCSSLFKPRLLLLLDFSKLLFVVCLVIRMFSSIFLTCVRSKTRFVYWTSLLCFASLLWNLLILWWSGLLRVLSLVTLFLVSLCCIILGFEYVVLES